MQRLKQRTSPLTAWRSRGSSASSALRKPARVGAHGTLRRRRRRLGDIEQRVARMRRRRAAAQRGSEQERSPGERRADRALVGRGDLLLLPSASPRARSRRPGAPAPASARRSSPRRPSRTGRSAGRMQSNAGALDGRRGLNDFLHRTKRHGGPPFEATFIGCAKHIFVATTKSGRGAALLSTPSTSHDGLMLNTDP